jgi:hypothetical protein
MLQLIKDLNYVSKTYPAVNLIGLLLCIIAVGAIEATPAFPYNLFN